MGISIKKVIQILEDAERDFRKEPDEKLNNNLGLCDYIGSHKLIKYNLLSTRTMYQKKILGDHYSGGTYTFCQKRSQMFAWRTISDSMKTKRADWAAERLEYFRGLIKQGKEL